jgi:hypothetical protein
MSFPKACQIYQSDDCFGSRGEAASGFAPSPFIVSMSLGQLFLGGLVSTRAHLRFTSRFQFSISRLKPSTTTRRGLGNFRPVLWGIFNRS